MDFSIILNSRGRPHLLMNLLDSIFSGAVNSNSTQVIVGVDNDDVRTLQSLPLIKATFADLEDNIVIEVGDRPTNLHTAINKLSQKATGKYIFILNDDVLFLTKGWDEKISTQIENKLDNFQDRILYAAVSDTSIDKAEHQNYASFPIITKEAADCMGSIMHENFVGLGGDVCLYRIFEQIDRVLFIKDVHLDHIFHSSLERVVNPDETAAEMRKNTWENPADPWTQDISKEVKSLNEKITSSL
tara:strand:+ start:9660 stop:10391 length:732 start_codon:yes stop_codon:yes gene_type:complete